MQPPIRLQADATSSQAAAIAAGFKAPVALSTNGRSPYSRHNSHSNNHTDGGSFASTSGTFNGIDSMMPPEDIDEDARSGDLTYYDDMLLKLRDSPATRWPATKEAVRFIVGIPT